jgi:membrane-associated phospholipid phosphatase
MHLTQPLIALWFLRQSKRMLIALAIYDVVLCVAIVLLEWHYLVDLISGAIVAAVAIWLVAPAGKIPEERPANRSEVSLCETPAR